MATPDSINLSSVPMPKLIESNKYKVRRDVLDTSQDVIPTSSVLPSFQDRVIHFKIERASNKYINLSLVKIHLELAIKDKHNKLSAENPNDVKSVIVGNPFASLFKNVVIKVNGTPISEASGLYPYVSQHLLLTKIHPVYRKAVEQSGRIYYDHEDTKMMPRIGDSKFSNVGLDPMLWKDLSLRQEKYEIGSIYPVDVTFYLFTDVTSSQSPVVLPPSATVDIELHPNDPQRTIILDKVGLVEPVVVVSKAELIVPRITPSQHVPKAIEHQYMRVSAQPVIIPQSSTNYNGTINFPGTTMPSRLTMVFASMASFDGNYADNMYASVPRNIEKISFTIGGKHFPATPLMADFSMDRLSDIYLRTNESLRFSLDRTQQSLPSINSYASREFIYSVDISSDYSSDSTWTTNPGQGAVSMQLHFGEPTFDQMVVILISETVATLQIGEDGSVSLE